MSSSGDYKGGHYYDLFSREGTPDKLPHRTILEDYNQRRAYYQQQQDKLEVSSNYYTYLRLFIFLLIIFTGIFFEIHNGFTLVSAGLMGILVTIFIALVISHQKHRDRTIFNAHFLAVNETGVQRIQRCWKALKPIPESIDICRAKVNHDLDIVGEASLGKLIFNQSTCLGEQRLADWLDGQSSIQEIQARQKAINELISLIEFRQKLSAIALISRGQERFLEAFAPWSRDVRTIPAWIVTIARILTVSMIISILLISAGFFPVIAIMPVFAGNILIFLIVFKKSGQEFKELENQAASIGMLADMCNFAAKKNFASQFLNEHVATHLCANGTAHLVLRQLERLLYRAQLRFNLMPYLFLQLFFSWDIHMLDRINRWKKQHGESVSGWLDKIADLEACNALATLAYENPDWCTPSFTGEVNIDIRNAGHPLIEPDKAIKNDICIQPPTQLLMITGSNMSGKTTYLRTLGLNVKMALMGGRVCADSMTLPCLTLVSSIGAQDSLKDGYSYFMQELLQLKQVVDTVRTCSSRPVLMLLDEILNGTNGPEREVAVIEVITQLLAKGAIGAVTTHDINIARALQSNPVVRHLYFQEHIDEHNNAKSDHAITFDYKTKPGIVKNTNALKLLRLVGIDITHTEI